MVDGQKKNENFNTEDENQPRDISQKGGIAEGSVEDDMPKEDQGSLSDTGDR